MREATILTPLAVSRKTSYLEWGTQPSMFKHYPAFCYRIPIRGNEKLEWLLHVRSITDSKMLGSKPYHRLNVPSAGNLHPIEMYVQVRGIEGVLEGIYHLDVLEESLVLICEIAKEGIEAHIGSQMRINGFIILFSLVPFRSEWKYGLRSWRYLYLDLGHQLAALRHTSDYFGLGMTNVSLPADRSIDRVMGMGEGERIVAAFSLGTVSSREAKRFCEPLMHVSPCDYTRRNDMLMDAIDTVVLNHAGLGESGWECSLTTKRRSAREFNPSACSDAMLRRAMTVPKASCLDVYHIVLRASDLKCGVYREGVCIEEGNFADEVYRLLLNQRFVLDCDMVSLVYGEDFDASTHVEAGFYVQELYVKAIQEGGGCSGIGAFFDDEGLRWSHKPLLYAAAIGEIG